MSTHANAVLDAGAFPHIFDKVLANLSPQELFQLRALSRDVRDLVDAQITCLRAVLVDHRWRCPKRCSPPGGVVPFRPGISAPASSCVQDLPIPGTLLKVLQLRNACEDRLASVLEAIGTVHTIQRSGQRAVLGDFPTQPPPGITVIVDCLDFSLLNFPTVLYRIPGAGAREEKYHRLVVPKVRRYLFHAVINTAHRRLLPVHQESRHDIRFVFPDTLRNFVLVLWPHLNPNTSGDNNTMPHDVETLPFATSSLLDAAVAAAEGQITTTVVGAERILSLLSSNGGAKANDPTEVVEMVRQLLHVRYSTKVNRVQQQIDKARAGLNRISEDKLVELSRIPRHVLPARCSTQGQLLDEMCNVLREESLVLEGPGVLEERCKRSFGTSVGNLNRYEIQKELEMLRGYWRREALISKEQLARLKGMRMEEALSRITFLSLDEWWQELGPIRRHYEGLAPDSSMTDGDEALSLRLLQQ